MPSEKNNEILVLQNIYCFSLEIKKNHTYSTILKCTNTYMYQSNMTIKTCSYCILNCVYIEHIAFINSCVKFCLKFLNSKLKQSCTCKLRYQKQLLLSVFLSVHFLLISKVGNHAEYMYILLYRPVIPVVKYSP